MHCIYYRLLEMSLLSLCNTFWTYSHVYLRIWAYSHGWKDFPVGKIADLQNQHNFCLGQHIKI